MPDIVDSATRSRMMAGIRATDTRPELAIRQALHGRGFRYRLHARNIPGKPDMVFPKLRAAIFVHGCFWHGHDCRFFRMPGTRTEFWRTKIDRNRVRDATVRDQLTAKGWRQLVVWECAIRGQGRNAIHFVTARATEFLRGSTQFAELRGD